ncbi:hypothetical protein C8J57DRAFT_1598782 [Mycena rebaudengoi]|nr:hypothetical protein C8J57DRAFT_1598782 [Mycena rebaudengoi]
MLSLIPSPPLASTASIPPDIASRLDFSYSNTHRRLPFIGTDEARAHDPHAPARMTVTTHPGMPEDTSLLWRLLDVCIRLTGIAVSLVVRPGPHHIWIFASTHVIIPAGILAAVAVVLGDNQSKSAPCTGKHSSGLSPSPAARIKTVWAFVLVGGTDGDGGEGVGKGSRPLPHSHSLAAVVVGLTFVAVQGGDQTAEAYRQRAMLSSSALGLTAVTVFAAFAAAQGGDQADFEDSGHRRPPIFSQSGPSFVLGASAETEESHLAKHLNAVVYALQGTQSIVLRGHIRQSEPSFVLGASAETVDSDLAKDPEHRPTVAVWPASSSVASSSLSSTAITRNQHYTEARYSIHHPPRLIRQSEPSLGSEGVGEVGEMEALKVPSSPGPDHGLVAVAVTTAVVAVHGGLPPSRTLPHLKNHPSALWPLSSSPQNPYSSSASLLGRRAIEFGHCASTSRTLPPRAVVLDPPPTTLCSDPSRTIALSPSPNTSLNARAPSTAASAALFGRCPPPLRTHLDPATPAEHFRTSWALSMRPPRISQRPCAVHRPLHCPLWIPPAALGGPTHIYPPPPRRITGALHPCTVVVRVTRAAQSTTRIPVSSMPPSSPPNFLFFLTTHPYGPFAQPRCISFFPAILLFYNSLPIQLTGS